MSHESSLRRTPSIFIAITFLSTAAVLSAGCAPGETKKAPAAATSRTSPLADTEGGDWGSNCTMPGVASRAKGNDFGDKLFARQGILDPTDPTSRFDESLYIHGTMFRGGGGEACSSDSTCGGGRICSCERDAGGNCVRAGTCFAHTIDDLRENLNDKFHKWGGPPARKLAPVRTQAHARAWDVDALGQQRGDSDPYRDAQSQPIAYSMGRDSISLLQIGGDYLGLTPLHLNSRQLWSFRTYLAATLQVARIPAPRPGDPGHTSAVLVENLMIADGLQSVPLGARLSCLAPEGVFSLAMDPCDPTKVLGYYAFSGALWGTNERPNRVFQNLPATIPMPSATADLKTRYRKVPKPPPGIIGLSETSTIVMVAGSACLDSETCKIIPLIDIEVARIGTEPAATELDAPGIVRTSSACAILADDGLSYRGRIDTGRNCVGCTANDECVRIYGNTGAVCYASNARVGANVYRTCVIQTGCTPSPTFDYSAWTSAQASGDPSFLRQRVTMETYTCHVPMEVLPPAKRTCAPLGLDLESYGVYWCAHVNVFGGTDPSGFFSGATGVQLREECGHDQSGL